MLLANAVDVKKHCRNIFARNAKMGFQKTISIPLAPSRGRLPAFDKLDTSVAYDMFEIEGHGESWLQDIDIRAFDNPGARFSSDCHAIRQAAFCINAAITRDTDFRLAFIFPFQFIEVECRSADMFLHNLWHASDLRNVIAPLDGYYENIWTRESDADLVHIIMYDANYSPETLSLHISTFNAIAARLLDQKVAVQLNLESNNDTRFFNYLAGLHPIDVYLDDERKTPPRMVRVCTPAELLFLIENGAHIRSISFDHDLGFIEHADGTSEEIRGIDVLNELEELVFHNRNYFQFGLPEMTIHSANPVGRKNMDMAIQNIERMYYGR